jgi:salicylate hydroxylase
MRLQYSDLHRILYDAAIRAGAEVIFNADVRLASPPAQGTSASVQLRDGTVLHADMIIGADGQHSTVRTSVQRKRVVPQATETVVFTGHIPMNRLLEDDTLQADKFAFSWVYWFGPRRAVLGGLIFIDISVPVSTSPAVHHVLGYPIVSLGKRGSECPSRRR